MELSKTKIRVNDPLRRGFQAALKYVVQDIEKNKKAHIAMIILDKPKDIRFYLLRKPEQLNDNKEFSGFKKEGRIKNVRIYELAEKRL
jgi:hypothetical protein